MFDQPDHTWLESILLAINAWIGLLTPTAGVVGLVWAVWKGLKELRQAREQKAEQILQRAEQIRQSRRDAKQRKLEEQWRRSRFVCELMAAMFAKPKVKTALLLLDYNRIIVGTDGQRASGHVLSTTDGIAKQFVIDDSIIISSLRDHTTMNAGEGFTPQEMICREAFDELFHELETLNAHVTNKLITPKDIEPYLVYWIRLLSCPELIRKRAAFYRNVSGFLHAYSYFGVVVLCKHFTGDSNRLCDLSPLAMIPRVEALEVIEKANSPASQRNIQLF